MFDWNDMSVFFWGIESNQSLEKFSIGGKTSTFYVGERLHLLDPFFRNNQAFEWLKKIGCDCGNFYQQLAIELPNFDSLEEFTLVGCMAMNLCTEADNISNTMLCLRLVFILCLYGMICTENNQNQNKSYGFLGLI